MMVDERKNIKIPRELFERLEQAKPDHDTWEQFLEKLLKEAPVRAARVRVEDDQVGEIARETADELEERLR